MKPIPKKSRRRAPKPAVHDRRPDHPDIPVWKCPNCGQGYFGEFPPDLCDYCQDFTTWERVRVSPADD